MLRAFSTAATGMSSQQTMVDVIANNLANVNTNGFKKSQVNFKDLIYAKTKAVGREVVAGVTSPGGVEIGNGVRVDQTTKVFTVGEFTETERPLDVAIEGDGFLQVTDPQTGSYFYTRDGSLMVDGTGQLVTSGGYTLGISVPTDYSEISIGTDGTVTTKDSDGNSSAAGNIQLAKFANPVGLSNEGNNLYRETESSGTATLGTPGSDGLGRLQGGFLENSNVQMVTELVSLITAQRAYEINSRAIKAGDDMLQTANQIVT